MERSEHTTPRYVSDEKIHKAIKKPLFNRKKTAEEDLYEVEVQKSTITHRKLMIDEFFTELVRAENVGALLKFFEKIFFLIKSNFEN